MNWIFPSPVWKAFMKLLRLGIVADTIAQVMMICCRTTLVVTASCGSDETGWAWNWLACSPERTTSGRRNKNATTTWNLSFHGMFRDQISASGRKHVRTSRMISKAAIICQRMNFEKSKMMPRTILEEIGCSIYLIFTLIDVIHREDGVDVTANRKP